MKKLLVIVVLSLLFGGNAYSQVIDPFKINLTCQSSKDGIPISVSINTALKKVSLQGSDPDSYYLKNDVFNFSMLAGKYTYSYYLNRNTGLLKIKAFIFSKEQKNKHNQEVFDTLVANKQINLEDGTYDKSNLVKIIFEIYEQKKPEEIIFMECEKSKAKF